MTGRARGILWRIAWRNLGRNRRRTFLTASGLAVGYLAVVLNAGLMDGLVAEMVENGTGLFLGQLQLHDPDYLPERDPAVTLGRGAVELEALLRAVEADPDVGAAAPRVYGGGLLATDRATEPAVLVGIDAAREGRVTRLLASLRRGRLPGRAAGEVLLGEEMARRLGVRPGDEVVVVAPAADGSLGNDLLTVSGIFRTGLSDLDAGTVLLPLATLQGLLVLGPMEVHEIVASAPDPWAAPRAAARLRASLGGAAPVEVRAWTEFRPDMLEYVHLGKATAWIVLIIVFVMAVFGVANTMLLATFERRRELALLVALGLRPGGVVGAVLREALALGSLALVAGLAVTVPVLVWWHRAPPDLSWIYGEFTMAGALIRPILRVEYPYGLLALTAGALFLTALLAALYPAVRAARIPPAKALEGR